MNRSQDSSDDLTYVFDKKLNKKPGNLVCKLLCLGRGNHLLVEILINSCLFRARYV